MCVFDPSAMALCSPLVPITVAYSPIATSAAALCPGLTTHHHLSTSGHNLHSHSPPHHHHHHHHHHPHHHHSTPHQSPPQILSPQSPHQPPVQPGPLPLPLPPPPLPSSVPPLVTSPVTTTQLITTSPPTTLTTTLPHPPPPPAAPLLTSFSLIPTPSATGFFIQPPPPPPPPPTALTQITTTTTSSSPLNGCPPLIKPCPWNQSYGMEHVWMAHFTSLFKSYPHQWCLIPVEQRPLGGNFSTFVDSAKVRFCCEECGHGWTSMKGRVAFWFDLASYSNYPQGLVTFKLFGQQCQKCKAEIYEPPMWYPEEVFKVLVNLFNRVGQNYYGFYYPPLEKTRRPGKPRTPHNSTLCQACKDGVCTNRK